MNIKNTLFLKVFILILMAIFFVLSIFSYEATRLQQKSILDTIESKAKSMSDSIVFVNTDFMIVNDEVKILEFIYDFVQANKDIKQLTLSRRNGNDLIIQEKKWELKENVIKNKLKDENIIKKEEYKIEYSNAVKENVFKYSYPIYLSSIHWGWIHFELSLDEYNKKINSMYKQFLILLEG